ncbi:MAG TPA: YggS family pyridoxal phosphate-dependent enzyme, partial [Thermoanaerobaculia bacterium]|nr:YggS family pyridoxal phosphate-dependent enzyme [Thermoanaerobaculia bacterium]
RSARSRDEITLVAVTKTHGADVVRAALAAGIADIGENRVQEAREKIGAVGRRARWHLIGHLQSNKAVEAARLFDVVQSVDSASLAEKLGKAAANEGKTIDVLIQVNVGSEEQKSGADPGAAESLARAIEEIPSLRLRGLMTVPPFLAPEEVRPYFRELRALRDAIRAWCDNCRELSMGMSDDFEVAIEEGATMIRLGRALFGARG